MANAFDYSTTPASNTTLFPEDMAPSAVNNGMRQVQADVVSALFQVVQSGIINGGCRVSMIAAPSLSTSYQYGAVEMFSAKADGTVGAGTISQNTSATIGSTGNSLKLAGVTLTGSGAVYARYLMEAKDAAQYANGPLTFAVQCSHDVGSSVNYTVTINKADSADTFSAVTEIDASDAQAVASATETTVFLSVADAGACGNGLEFIVKADCGAVTTKNFEFADFRVANITAVPNYFPRRYTEELAACLRYFYRITCPTGQQVFVANGVWNSTTAALMGMTFPVPMRTKPTMSYSDIGIFDIEDDDLTVTSFADEFADTLVSTFRFSANVASGGTAGDCAHLVIDTNAGWVQFSARLS